MNRKLDSRLGVADVCFYNQSVVAPSTLPIGVRIIARAKKNNVKISKTENNALMCCFIYCVYLPDCHTPTNDQSSLY